MDESGGAIQNAQGGTLTIDSSRLLNNATSIFSPDGGAILSVGGATTIKNSTLHGNHATLGGRGGAVYNAPTIPVIPSGPQHRVIASR
jgi:hypothetical protein